MDTDGNTTADACVECTQDSQCNDGNLCTIDACDLSTNTCQTSSKCEDDNVCTTDTCDVSTGECENTYEESNANECITNPCGNWVIDEGEACDFGDGNGTGVAKNGQTCSASCTLENSVVSCECNIYDAEQQPWAAQGISQHDLAIVEWCAETYDAAGGGQNISFVYDDGNGDDLYECDQVLAECDPDGDGNPIATDDPASENDDLVSLAGIMNGEIDLSEFPFAAGSVSAWWSVLQCWSNQWQCDPALDPDCKVRCRADIFQCTLSADPSLSECSAWQVAGDTPCITCVEDNVCDDTCPEDPDCDYLCGDAAWSCLAQDKDISTEDFDTRAECEVSVVCETCDPSDPDCKVRCDEVNDMCIQSTDIALSQCSGQVAGDTPCITCVEDNVCDDTCPEDPDCDYLCGDAEWSCLAQDKDISTEDFDTRAECEVSVVCVECDPNTNADCKVRCDVTALQCVLSTDTAYDSCTAGDQVWDACDPCGDDGVCNEDCPYLWDPDWIDPDCNAYKCDVTQGCIKDESWPYEGINSCQATCYNCPIEQQYDSDDDDTELDACCPEGTTPFDSDGDLIPDTCVDCSDDDICNIECPNDPDCDDHTCNITLGCVMDPAGEYTDENQCTAVCESCPVELQYDSDEDSKLDKCCKVWETPVDGDDEDDVPDRCENCSEDDICNIECPNDPDCDDHTCNLTLGCVLDPAGDYTNENQCTAVCESCPVELQYDSDEDSKLDKCCKVWETPVDGDDADDVPDSCQNCGEDNICNILCPNDPDCNSYSCNIAEWCVQHVDGPYTNQNQCLETCNECAEAQQYDSDDDKIVDACCPEDKDAIDANGDGIKDFCGCLPAVCDDWDPDTINDMIDKNCACEGESMELSISDPYECGWDFEGNVMISENLDIDSVVVTLSQKGVTIYEYILYVQDIDSDWNYIIPLNYTDSESLDFVIADAYELTYSVNTLQWFSEDGGYSVEITNQCILCGNGTIDPGEQCDDANDNDNDGCTSVCRFQESEKKSWWIQLRCAGISVVPQETVFLDQVQYRCDIWGDDKEEVGVMELNCWNGVIQELENVGDVYEWICDYSDSSAGVFTPMCILYDKSWTLRSDDLCKTEYVKSWWWWDPVDPPEQELITIVEVVDDHDSADDDTFDTDQVLQQLLEDAWPICGNGVIEWDEECDGEDICSATCMIFTNYIDDLQRLMSLSDDLVQERVITLPTLLPNSWAEIK